MNLTAILSHPFTLLIFGALISKYLIPRLTNTWQSHRNEFEFKSETINHITELVITFLMSIQFVEVGAKSQSQEEYDLSFKAWEIDKSKLTSNLQCYFEKDEIIKEWNRLNELVTNIYTLSGVNKTENRILILNKIKNLLSETSFDIEVLKNQRPARATYQDNNIEYQKLRQEYLKEWSKMKEGAIAKLGYLNKRILTDKTRISTNYSI